ncbi:MAG: hypothetical protein LBO20_06710, partial [Bifidobacteriaceae bacterium]|nr:hypothetical protein [Bifidobacteriaceae bacterium]
MATTAPEAGPLGGAGPRGPVSGGPARDGRGDPAGALAGPPLGDDGAPPAARWPVGGGEPPEWWLDFGAGEAGNAWPDWVRGDDGWDQAGGGVLDDEESWDAPVPDWVEALGRPELPGWVFEEVDRARAAGLGEGAAGSAAARLAAVEAAGLTPLVDAWMLEAAGGGSVAGLLGAAVDVAAARRRLEGLEGRLVAAAARVREAEGGAGWSAVEEHS